MATNNSAWTGKYVNKEKKQNFKQFKEDLKNDPFKKVVKQDLQYTGEQIVNKTKRLVAQAASSYAPAERSAQRIAKSLVQKKSKGPSQQQRERLAMLNKQRQLLAAMRRGEEIQQQTPNKFDMIVAARAKRLNEMDANRRFHAPDKNHAAKMNMIHQREMARRRDDEQRNSLMKAHENMMDVKMDFLETQNSILMAENIFSQNNPRKMDINRTGRPNVLQVPNDQKIMNTKMRLKFF